MTEIVEIPAAPETVEVVAETATTEATTLEVAEISSNSVEVAEISGETAEIIDTSLEIVEVANEIVLIETPVVEYAEPGAESPDLSGYQAKTEKDDFGGYAGLTQFKLNIKNAAGSVLNFFTNATTAARTWTFPDKDGTVAMTSDITGTNSGTNTGDQDLSGLQAKSEKDASGGYAGLTLLKLNLLNAAGTFTNFLTNATTAARTWTFPDKDGTVAMTSDITGTNSGVNTGDQDLSGLQAKSEKDASNGYAGLTLLKLNLLNAAGTFTNFLTNATTAARTWTFPDKDGTVAMVSDITGTNSGTNTGDQDLSGLQAKSEKDASNGYAGLTLLKLNLLNAAGTFTNFLTNATTAARTWTMPDKDGTVAMTSDITGTNSGTNTGDQDLSGLQAKTEKDASGGYAGLTLLKLNLLNAAGTFTNFLTNTTTAARTWTFPDKDGTVAMSDDVIGKNWIINSRFNIAQRGTSQTANGYGSLDAWYFLSAGTTKTVSREAFTLGQTDVSGNPENYLRVVVSSVAGANNNCNFDHRIAGVGNIAGGNVTLSFDAKADANKNIGISLDQNFGTGGSPSTAVTGSGTLVALTTVWARKTVTITLPSISGKTLGTDDNDFTKIIFWLDAGSNLNTRSGTLGQQSGTFEFANIKLELGDVDTPYVPDNPASEMLECQLRYWRGKPGGNLNGNGYAANCIISAPIYWKTTMRAVPTLGSSIAGLTYQASSGFTFNNATENGARMYIATTGATTNAYVVFGANDYLEASADL